MKNLKILNSVRDGRGLKRRLRDRLVNPILFMIVVLGAAQGMVSPVRAADPPAIPPKGALAESVRVSPTKFEIMLKPGQESTAPIEVQNSTRQKMKITVAAWNFARDDNGVAYPIPAKDEAHFRGAASWISGPLKPIALQSGETTTFILNILAPKKAALGSYSAYVKIIGTPAVKRGKSLTVRYVIDALVLPIVMNRSHSVSRSLTAKVEFGGMSTKGSLHTSLPFDVVAKVRNRGNIHQNFDGAIEIWQGKIRLNRISLKRTLLPLATSTFIGTVEELPYFGKLTAKFSGSAFVAKSYRQQTIKGRVTFWYVPALFIYAAGGIALILLIGGIILVRRLRVTKTEKSPDDQTPVNKDEVPEDQLEPTQVL